MRVAFLSLSLCAACSDLSLSTSGELGNLEFERENTGSSPVSDDCFTTCPVDKPLMVGTTERIILDTRPLPLLHSRSSDESIVTVLDHVSTCCGGECRDGDHYDDCLAQYGEASYSDVLAVSAVGRGTAKLELFDADNKLIDRLPLEVAPPARIDIELHQQTDSTWSFTSVSDVSLRGQRIDIRAVARDRDGRALFAAKGISMTLPDMDIVAFDGDRAMVDGSYGHLWPLARGSDAMTATAGDRVETFAIKSE